MIQEANLAKLRNVLMFSQWYKWYNDTNLYLWVIIKLQGPVIGISQIDSNSTTCYLHTLLFYTLDYF